MAKHKLSPPVVAAIAATVTVAVPALVAGADNPFQMQPLASGYMLAQNANTPHHHSHKHRSHRRTKHNKSNAKVQEGTCAAEHRKAMEGRCGGAPTQVPVEPDK